MIYLHLGCDEYLSSQRILELKRELGDAEMADLNTSTLQGDRATAADVLGEASMMPFLAVKRLVLVYGLLDSLDKRMAASKGTDGAAYQPVGPVVARHPSAEHGAEWMPTDSSSSGSRGR